ncbi:hypothetical protein DLM75_20285 [Leptospira stimsonii]|uniref:Uncharacterized protein n=1 Tax=Leptospira stimsonii TaxID=2202203 RepID=A0A396YWZ0_9LEPT|nr:hypothetical protein DLM75_20285 [Leptospira stimsonii]
MISFGVFRHQIQSLSNRKVKRIFPSNDPHGLRQKPCFYFDILFPINRHFTFFFSFRILILF